MRYSFLENLRGDFCAVGCAVLFKYSFWALRGDKQKRKKVVPDYLLQKL